MTNDHPQTKVLQAIETVTGSAPRSNGSGWIAKCPAHPDKSPSLSIGIGADGRVLLTCHAGCKTEAIVSAIGLTTADLFVPRSGTNGRTKAPPRKKPAPLPKVYPTAADATAAIERSIGRSAAMSWVYQDVECHHVGTILRWDKPDGSKDTIRPITRTDAGWIIGAMPKPRPLYRLPGVRKSTDAIVVCEGEKAADAAFGIGLTATTSAGGSKAAHAADWTPLAGRDAVILPDHDKAGERYANDVAAILAALDPPATVRIVELPGLPDHGDIVEFVGDRDGLECSREIEKLAADVPVFVPHDDTIDVVADVMPTEPVVSPYVPFVTDTLPEPMRRYVHETADAIGVDDAFVALPLLAALASAIGSASRLLLKPGYSEPSILWTAIVGPSGTMKTPTLAEVVRPVKRRQAEAYNVYEKKMTGYALKLQAYEKELAKWKRSKGGGDPPEKPEVPIWERCWLSDVTIEKVYAMLQTQPRGLLLILDELASWFGSFGRYSKSDDRALWLPLYNGLSAIIDRKTSPTIRVPFGHVCIAGGVQPAVLRRALGTENVENGLASRLFLAAPPPHVASWSERHASDETLTAINNVFDGLYRLEHDTDEHGKPKPSYVRLTSEARKVWIEYHDRNGCEQADLTDDLRAAWSKLKGGGARMALVFHHVRWVSGDPTQRKPSQVDEVSMTAGVQLAEWFCGETKRVYSIMAAAGDDSPTGPPAEVKFIVKLGGAVSVRDWQRVRNHQTSDAAEAELAGFIAAGYGCWEWPKQGKPGKPPSKRFVLN